MKRVEVRVREEAGEVISEQQVELDTGRGRFVEAAKKGLAVERPLAGDTEIV